MDSNKWKTVNRKNGGRQGGRRFQGRNKFNVNKTRELFTRVANGSLNPESAMRMMNRRSGFRPVPETPSFKVTRSGALAVYGFSPRPVVLYANQWQRLLEFFSSESAFDTFVGEHSEELREVNFVHRKRRTSPTETQEEETHEPTQEEVSDEFNYEEPSTETTNEGV